MNPYNLAADDNKRIDANLKDHFRLADVSDLGRTQMRSMAPAVSLPERVQILNYLRTVRTHIELLEYFVTHDAPEI